MKPIGKLMVKCFCVLFPFFVLWFYIGSHPLAFVGDLAPYYIWNREKTNTRQEERYKVVILGDSVANAAYVPEVLSPNTINLSLGGTTPAENYYTLQNWLAHNPAPDVCYISFVDSHLWEQATFWSTAMYSHYFRLSQNLELLKAAIAYKEPSFLTEHYWLDFISYQLYLPNKYITPFLNASFNQRYKTNVEAIQADELHGGRYVSRRKQEDYSGNKSITYEEFHANPLFDEYYKKIIELCLENSITVRIVKLPLPDDAMFTDNYKKTFYEYYKSLQEEYPSITVDWFPAYPINHFLDPHHMNSHGALRFSTELKERYPEDFASSGMSAKQIAAINDSIKDENKIEWILKWISGKDYTVLFCDNSGTFPAMYKKQLRKEWETGAKDLYAVPIEGADASPDGEGLPGIWGISGMKGSAPAASVFLTEDGLMLQPQGQEAQPWITAFGNGLGVAVIDNYNHSVVCMKSFRYVDELLALVQ